MNATSESLDLKSSSRVVPMFLSLLLLWLLLHGSVALDVVGVGIVAALVIALMFRNGLSLTTGYHFTPRSFIASLAYLVYFLWALIKANISLAVVVLTPTLPLNPGIVKVRTTLKSPVGRLLLANSISLTPGTLTVKLDGEWFYVHWVRMKATDSEQATARIVAGFERYLKVMYD